MSKTIICSMGGGFSSTAWLPRVLLEEYPKDQIHFVTAVLPNEHPTMWNLYDAVEKELDIAVTYIAYDKEAKWQYVEKEDRTNIDKLWTPFDIFDDVSFLGNSRRDPCSRILKRETMLNYIRDNFKIEDCVLAVGIHSDEIDRMASIYQNWKNNGYEVIFPLIEKESYTKEQQIGFLQEWYNVSLLLYELDFEHNNCAGACVKAGQRQWAMLWYYFPTTYQEWEERENVWRLKHGNYTILKKTISGQVVHLTLKEFRVLFLEPAMCAEKETFLTRFIKNLPGNPSCMWCSSI